MKRCSNCPDKCATKRALEDLNQVGCDEDLHVFINAGNLRPALDESPIRLCSGGGSPMLAVTPSKRFAVIASIGRRMAMPGLSSFVPLVVPSSRFWCTVDIFAFQHT